MMLRVLSKQSEGIHLHTGDTQTVVTVTFPSDEISCHSEAMLRVHQMTKWCMDSATRTNLTYGASPANDELNAKTKV